MSIIIVSSQRVGRLTAGRSIGGLKYDDDDDDGETATLAKRRAKVAAHSMWPMSCRSR